VFWLRVRSLARDFPALARLDLAPDEVKTALENPGFVVVALVGEEIARFVDLDAPVDLLLSDRDPLEATLALRPTRELAKNTALPRREVAPGRFRLEPPERSYMEAKHCELWESASAGDRIVCGPSEHQVVQSAAFFFGRAASLPRGGPAFRAELSGRAVWVPVLEEVEREQRELGGAPNERAGSELGMRWARELLSGNRALVLELDLVGSEAELGFELVYEGEGPATALKAWFGSDRARALPDAFSKLPGDSELTFGFAGMDPGSATESLRERLREFATAVTAEFEIPESDRLDLERVTFEAMPTNGRFVLALGHDRGSIRELTARVDAAEAANKVPAPKDMTSLAAALAGWALVGIEADPKVYLENFRRLVEVYGRPFAKKPGGAGGTTAQPQANRRPHVTHIELATKALPNLPKGSVHAVVTARPNPEYKAPPDAPSIPLPHDVHVVVVPDGSQVWMAIARNEKVAAARARAQLGSKKGGATAGAKLAGNRTVAAASFTLSGLVGMSLGGDTPEERKASRLSLGDLEALPNRGRTKFPMRIEVVPHDDGTAWSVALRGRVPLPTMEDIVAFLESGVGADVVQ
jgi:hypothetical protein